MPNASVAIATFNCEWRRTASRDAEIIRQRVLADNVEVACLTETHEDFFGDHGFTINSPPFDTGIHPKTRRRVSLWSRNPWRDVRVSGPDHSPPGPHVMGSTDTSIGKLTFIGVIISYRWSGTKGNPPTAQLWQKHLEFLTTLDECLPETPARTVLLGDFNQRVPRKYQPTRIFEELERVLLRRFHIATAGPIPLIGRLAIDHICHSEDLVSTCASGLSNQRPDGGEISDHFGVRVELR